MVRCKTRSVSVQSCLCVSVALNCNIESGTEPTAPVPFSVPAPQGARYVKEQTAVTSASAQRGSCSDSKHCIYA